VREKQNNEQSFLFVVLWLFEKLILLFDKFAFCFTLKTIL